MGSVSEEETWWPTEVFVVELFQRDADEYELFQVVTYKRRKTSVSVEDAEWEV